MPLGLDRTECGFDIVPATLVLECTSQKLREKGAAPSLSDPFIQFGHEIIFEAYV
jgi:hypothetical protein